MNDAFYSQKARFHGRPPEPELSLDFRTAFGSYLERLTEEDWLCAEFPRDVCDGFSGGRDDDAIALRCREELGYDAWPVREGAGTDRLLDLIQFFFLHVSKPTKSWFHDYCQRNHPTDYDPKVARYEYTIQVNKLFGRFNHPYRIQKGRIVRLSSELLDRVVFATEIQIDDNHLKELIQRALELFADRSGARKQEALRLIVGAFERLKTIEGGDKKRSVEQVLARVSPSAEIRAIMESHFRNITDLANRSTIRHHERDRAELRDPQFLEYLFYTYFNIVRLILQKYDGTA
jgi:hypothetical protein